MTTRNAPNARNARDTRTIVLAAAATAAVLASGQAQARSPVDVQWQVTIGSPAGGYPVPGGVVISAPVYLPPPVVVVPSYQPRYQPSYQPSYQPPYQPPYQAVYQTYYEPVYQPYYGPYYLQHQPQHQPRPSRAYREPTRWDVDGDGIPNRYDRDYRYNRHDRRGHRDGDRDRDRRGRGNGDGHEDRHR